MTVDAADIAEWGKFTTPQGAELTSLERVIDAVTDYIETHYYVDATPTDRQRQAIIMQSYKIWTRRGDPAGIKEFADITARSVMGLDSDVAMLLEERFSFGVDDA